MIGRKWTGIALAAVVLSGCRNAGTTSAVPEAAAGIATVPAYPSKRLVFPWSVVSGGVASPLAMREAMRDDAVVAAHYAGLKPAGFRAEALPTNRKGYVSYRIRDKIYWTRRMVTLQAGETILTDGETMVRGRCGNLISDAPRQPVAAAEAEPAEIAMDQPVREAHLMLSPALPGEPAVATEVIHNPKQIGTSENRTSALPAPDPQEMMPPVWTAGGVSSPMGGIVGVSSAGGAGGAPTNNPAPSVATTPEFPAALTVFVSVSTHPALIEVAPPLVIAALVLPPDQPNVMPSGYVWEHPLLPSPPPWLPRRDPPRVFYPPGGHPPREITPPPSGPPPANTPAPFGPPPANTPPPSGPPPANTPPPFGPPPANTPPPFGLPPHGLPPLDPPTLPPPGSPPPDTPVPEPSAWIMLALGLTGIAVGLFRRKF